jgi:hypothetical protein
MSYRYLISAKKKITAPRVCERDDRDAVFKNRLVKIDIDSTTIFFVEI